MTTVSRTLFGDGGPIVTWGRIMSGHGDAVVLSHEAGSVKPNPRIFQRAADLLACPR